jgi:glutaredoxin
MRIVLLLVLALSAFAANAGDVASRESATRAQPEVVMYAIEACGYCARARAYFQQRGISWKEFDIERDTAAAKRFAELGGVGTPLIFVGDERIAGFSPERIEQALAR